MIPAFLVCAVLSAADGGATVADAGHPDAGLAASADAGSVAGDGGVAATWRLSQKLGKGKPAREELIGELMKKGGGVGETELTRAEAEAIIDDPRAEAVYGDKTISIVAPSMLTRQRQGHLDLMAKFLQPERVEAGLKFRDEKKDVLEATEKKTGVDREVIIGILMWESKLGTITGDWVAFNALASQAYFIDEANAEALRSTDEKALLSVAAPKKKKGEKLTDEEKAKLEAAREELQKKQAARVESIRARAKKNLLSLIRQCKTRGIDVFTMKGSWAGALGFPQFMPASLRWAEDGNGDGAIDLFVMDDAIASVGKYLQAAGFKKSARDAVYDYNHEAAYVDGVLAFAAALKGGLDAGVGATAVGAPSK